MKAVLNKEFNYFGKRMRPFYRIWGLAISDDGKTVLRYYQNDIDSSGIPKRPPKKLSLQTDEDGRIYINTRDHGKLIVANMVAACFCPPCPNPSSEYELIHRDGNPLNCHYMNLEWEKRPQAPKTTLHTLKDYIKLPNGLTVHKDGSVYDKGEKLITVISLYDSDTNLEWAIQPRVRYYRLNKWRKEERLTETLDSLMCLAGYINGDKYQFANPRILHRDYDWLNFDSSNLEYCDATDQRYIEYSHKQAEDMNEWNKANNKDFPDCFLDKPD